MIDLDKGYEEGFSPELSESISRAQALVGELTKADDYMASFLVSRFDEAFTDPGVLNHAFGYGGVGNWSAEYYLVGTTNTGQNTQSSLLVSLDRPKDIPSRWTVSENDLSARIMAASKRGQFVVLPEFSDPLKNTRYRPEELVDIKDIPPELLTTILDGIEKDREVKEAEAAEEANRPLRQRIGKVVASLFSPIR